MSDAKRERTHNPEHDLAQDAVPRMAQSMGPYESQTKREVLESITLDVRNHGMYGAGAVREVTDHEVSRLCGLRDRIDAAIGAIQDGRA